MAEKPPGSGTELLARTRSVFDRRGLRACAGLAFGALLGCSAAGTGEATRMQAPAGPSWDDASVRASPDLQSDLQRDAATPGGTRPDVARVDASGIPAGGEPPGSQAEGAVRPAWASYGHDLTNSQTNLVETRLGAANLDQLEEKWRVEIAGGATSLPAVYDGTAYFGGWDGRFYAVDARTGELRWQRTLSQLFVRASPLVTEQRVYVPAYRSVFALDRRDGSVLFETVLDKAQMAIIDASPKLIEDLIVIGMASAENVAPKADYTFVGSINALDAQSGELVWRVETSGEGAGPCTGGAGVGVWSTAAFDPELGLAYLGTGQNYDAPAGNCADALLAIHYRREHLGERVAWVAQYTQDDIYLAVLPIFGLDADVGGSPNLFEAGGKRLVGAGDKGGSYRAFDRATGQPVWRVDLDRGWWTGLGGVMTTAAVHDGTVYVASNHWESTEGFLGGAGDPADVATLYALDAASGVERWRVALPSPMLGSFAIANGLLYHGIINGTLYARELVSGTEVWSLALGGAFGVGPTVVDGRIFVANGVSIAPNPDASGKGIVASFGLVEGAAGTPNVVRGGPVQQAAPVSASECEAVLAENDPPPNPSCSACLCRCDAIAWGRCPLCWPLSACTALFCSLEASAAELRGCIADACVAKLIPPGQFELSVQGAPCLSTCASECG
jgi:polyvinyl alcohol dehydrogenase (cytochrome)